MFISLTSLSQLPRPSKELRSPHPNFIPHTSFSVTYHMHMIHFGVESQDHMSSRHTDLHHTRYLFIFHAFIFMYLRASLVLVLRV